MPEVQILRVAVPAPLRETLDYLPPPDAPRTAQPGMRVIVPLGKRNVVGVVTELAGSSPLAIDRLKQAIAFPDPEPILSPDVLDLCLFASRYYHATPGEAVVNTLPTALRSLGGSRERSARLWRATPEAAALPASALARSPKQAAALAFLLEQGTASDAACRLAGIQTALLRALQARGLARRETCHEEPETLPPAPIPPPHPSPAQEAALQALYEGIGHFGCTLLEGVTGSGKTEVYLRLIERVLAEGRQALVLVPEIGLTPQTRQRFVHRFGSAVGVLHSGLGDRERERTWRQAAAGKLRVLIGTRSALFTPMPELGVIVVDEEHDSSFKQQEGFRYSARDLAVYRARQRDIPVLLGSATPSTESLANCRSGRFRYLGLPHRAGGANAPSMRLVDIRGQTLDGGLCAEVLDAIGTQLGSGNQVLVFLNRRGWAPLLSCCDCGWMADCHHCDARLTLHRARNLLWCHHCDARMPAPASCPGCNSARLLALGAGTERTEHTLQRHFPAFPVRRIDRGTMQGAAAMDRLYQETVQGAPCILVGTQMLAKGHHFPAVTLVVVVDLDAGLFSSDYRSAERTGQLLVQVGGRAGRAERPGEVIVQTLHPRHPWLERLLGGGYRAFIDPVLSEREGRGLPPFGHMAVLRTESPREQDANAVLDALKRTLRRRFPGVELTGPVPAQLAKRAGRYRVQLILRSAARGPLHAALEQACRFFDEHRFAAGERWQVDVDPLEGG
jgi:primosomal protein N' (replication factor Y) (superfamily II helicase)